MANPYSGAPFNLVALVNPSIDVGNFPISFNVSNFPAIQPVSQSGVWNINNVIGVISLPTGAATAASQTTQSTKLDTINTNLTNGTAILSPNPGLVYGMISGFVTTSTTTESAVRNTTYTEQSVNAQRSIISNNTFDGPFFGTGSVKITYYDQTGAGPFTETIAPNGTTAVNTVNTNICFIEKMEMVGNSTIVNGVYGTISLWSAINGTGVVVGSFSNADGGKTDWAHHYVATGKTCKIINSAISSTGNAAGQGDLFVIKAKKISGTNIFEPRISDYLTLEGAVTTTCSRQYMAPLDVIGPARITFYVTPSSGVSITHRAAFDYVEV